MSGGGGVAQKQLVVADWCVSVCSEQSSTFSTTELRPSAPPDRSPSGPGSLIATATSQQPADGNGARRTEVDHRKDGEGVWGEVRGQRSPGPG